MNKYYNTKRRKRYRLARKYIKDTYNKIYNDQKSEELGTYATHSKFKQYPSDRLVRKKDGTPNFEEEMKQVKRLKNQTFNSKSREYTPTEGDRIRGIVKEVKND